jgi:hypothetical protein
MATTETLYYYAVTYNATSGAVTVAANVKGAQISVSTPNALVTTADTNDVDDTTKSVENKYIGTVTVDGVKGYLVQDTSNNAYYVFLVSNITTTATTVTVTKPASTSATDPGNWNATTGNFACFVTGTGIATPDGDVAVESLKIGDLVTLSDGRTTPISWIGVNTVATRFTDPLRALPIRIQQNALGEGLPARDLLISADHALFLEGVLVQAGALINGNTITREENMAEVFTYYHVEVSDHSLILAENVPAETFVDNVSRMAFDNWEEHRALFGDDHQLAEMEYPRVKSVRQLPSALRARLGLQTAVTASRAAA